MPKSLSSIEDKDEKRKAVLAKVRKERERKEKEAEMGPKKVSVFSRVMKGDLRLWEVKYEKEYERRKDRKERLRKERLEKTGNDLFSRLIDGTEDDLFDEELDMQYKAGIRDHLRWKRNDLLRSLLPGGYGCMAYVGICVVIVIAVIMFLLLSGFVGMVIWSNKGLLLSLHP